MHTVWVLLPTSIIPLSNLNFIPSSSLQCRLMEESSVGITFPKPLNPRSLLPKCFLLFPKFIKDNGLLLDFSRIWSPIHLQLLELIQHIINLSSSHIELSFTPFNESRSTSIYPFLPSMQRISIISSMPASIN